MRKSDKPRKKVRFEEVEEEVEDVRDSEFQDPGEDEIDSEQDAIYHSGSSIDEAEDWEDFQNLQLVDTPSGVALVHNPSYTEPAEESKEHPKEVWQGDARQLKSSEYLDFENSAYTYFYRTSVEWSCLSVDFLPTPSLCMEDPYSVQLVSGSQAPPSQNKIYLMKWSELYPTQHDDKSESSYEGIDSEDSAQGDDTAQLDYIEIQHKGVVNRIRAHKEHRLVSTWSDTGIVYIYDISKAYSKLQDLRGIAKMKKELAGSFNVRQEGYGLCWGAENSLYAGGEALYQFVYNGSAWSRGKNLKGHSAPIEDIQQSPSEPFAIATCSVDRTVKVWDLRVAQSDSQLTIPEAHNCDVNVISWNTVETTQISSGADDGSFKVWDLRITQSPIAGITWHSDAVSSIFWNPGDSSELAVASSDDKITVWDFSVEPEGEVEPGVPAQLLFTHQGQEDIKEIAYHPDYQFIVSTAANSFNLFKPNIHLN